MDLCLRGASLLGAGGGHEGCESGELGLHRERRGVGADAGLRRGRECDDWDENERKETELSSRDDDLI